MAETSLGVVPELPFRRRRAGEGFIYLGKGGRRISDARRIDWIVGIRIPPAWEEVCIAADPQCHLLAVGRDQRGRKQYIYHPDWRATQEKKKFDRILAFAELLPKLKRRIARDLARPGLPREKVLALAVELMRRTMIRVGHESYAKENRTFGVATLQDAHVKIDGSQVQFRFVGKGGKLWELELEDRKIAAVTAACRAMPGRRLLQYLDGDGRARRITANEVNRYIREITDELATAKDLRTWAATVLAVSHLSRPEHQPESSHARKRAQAKVVREIAEVLGNTPAICRKSYVDPAVLEHHLDGSLEIVMKKARRIAKPLPAFTQAERRALAALRIIRRRSAAALSAQRGSLA